MPRKTALTVYAGFALACGAAIADTGHDEPNTYIRADTPQGRFECKRDDDTGKLEVLTLGGRVIYQEKSSPAGIAETGTLASGITQLNAGCPRIVANRHGFLVLARDDAPPAYGLRGYLIVDFNRPDLPMTPLGEGFAPDDDAIPEKRRLTWSAHGLRFRYFGYALAERERLRSSAKPRAHEVYYDFSKGLAQQRK